MRQPNILMIMADQLSALALSAYGHPVVRTPHLDALAAQGVVFENAYCNFPLCAPSRAPSRVVSIRRLRWDRAGSPSACARRAPQSA